MKASADFIATGHYARNERLPFCSRLTLKGSDASHKTENVSFRLLKAKDKSKDQSYFLWTLNQEILSKCLFPIGDYVKPEVRRIAKKFGLPNHAKKDSQGVCFIGPLDMKNFLKTYIKPKPGKIIYGTKQIGVHDGIYYYTIGQRHGLNITN